MNPHSFRTQALIIGGLWLVTALFVMPLWGLTYWDFGDGNYLYVGARINAGLVPYRDILAPQPPLHLLMSAFSQRVGGWFGNELIGARVYCLIVRLLGSLMVYFIATKLWGCMFRGIIAMAIYLALPIGFWWSICLQSENLELVFLLLAMYGIMQLDKRWAVAAGVGSALAMHCNMTGVPFFLCNALFLGVRRPKLFLYYAPTVLGVWGIGAIGAYVWAGEYYLSNVVLNQVGSFPKEEILGYSPLIYYKDKVLGEGWKILMLEGPLILIGLVAMGVHWVKKWKSLERNSDEYRMWEYAAWYCIGMLLSVGFVMKGGTVNYIFVLGEPAVAILAAEAIVATWHLARRCIANPENQKKMIPVALVAVLGVSTAVVWPPMWKNVMFTITHQQAELDTEGVLELIAVIEEHTNPGDPILAPPYYAYITDRLVAGELAENYLWQIKFLNETIVDQTEGEAVLKMREVAAMLRRKEVPLLLLDMKQTGRIPFIESAVAANYVALTEEYYWTRNTPLLLAVPE